ncbi:FG-GAP repeat domain-containing protein [Paenibacillus sp. y28]|uniref:FG-GAP repeat domain-containing protein n=1 Tax=Paenibacillus sp. y28 TaxID=3129110 RepID=UPI0030160052
MKKNWLCGIALATLFTSGCSLVAAPGDLLRAPAQNNSDQSISLTVKQFLPAGAHLTVPLHPQAGSAIRLQDLDADGQNEIVAFYKTDKTDFEVNILLLFQNDGQWSRADVITGIGKELDYVQFADATGDGIPEMLLGFGGGNGLSRELHVYSLKNRQPVELFKHTYGQLAVGDLNGDGAPEIALFDNELKKDSEQRSRVQLYGARDGRLEKWAEREIEGNVYRTRIGKAAPAKNGLFAEIAIGAHAAYTALLSWENGRLFDVLATEKPAWEEKAGSTDITLDQTDLHRDGHIAPNPVSLKDYPLDSMDTNGDGIIETGVLAIPPGAEDMPPLATPYISKYYQWDGGLRLNYTGERFDQWGYHFRIPPQWVGHYRLDIRRDTPLSSGEVRFLYVQHSTGREAPLLTLRMLSKQEWAKEEAGLQDQRDTYRVLDHIRPTETKPEPKLVIAFLPQETPDLYGTALQEYKQLLLSLEEIQDLARDRLDPGE